MWTSGSGGNDMIPLSVGSAIAAYLFAAICIIIKLFISEKFSSATIFVILQLIFFLGLVNLSNFEYKADRTLVYIYLIALIMFYCGHSLYRHYHPLLRKYVGASVELCHFQLERIVIIIIVCTLILTLFFARSGGNVFLQALRGLFSSSIENLTDQRLAFNSMSGVGYIYQIRVYIYPVLLIMMLYSGRPVLRKLSVLLLPLMLIFILGTGQRAGFVFCIAAWAIALLYFADYGLADKKKVWAIVIALALFALLVFSILTAANGRDQISGGIIQALLDRISNDNQESALIAFRYLIYDSPTQWGADWLNALADILPGKNDYIAVAYRVFFIMYGSMRGTAPECIWGSVFYNWSWLGVVLVPFILGMAHAGLYSRFVSRPTSKARIILYAFLFLNLGSWTAGGLVSLFNKGIVALLLLGVVLHIDGTLPKSPPSIRRRTALSGPNETVFRTGKHMDRAFKF